MSTIVVIAIAVIALVLGICGVVASSHKEILKDTDGAPYLNEKTFGKDGKAGKRLLIASSVVALTSTIISLVWT